MSVLVAKVVTEMLKAKGWDLSPRPLNVCASPRGAAPRCAVTVAVPPAETVAVERGDGLNVVCGKNPQDWVAP